MKCVNASNGKKSILYERLVLLTNEVEATKLYSQIFNDDFKNSFGLDWETYNIISRKPMTDLTTEDQLLLKQAQSLNIDSSLDLNSEPTFEAFSEVLNLNPESLALKKISDEFSKNKNNENVTGVSRTIENRIAGFLDKNLLNFNNEQFIENSIQEELQNNFGLTLEEKQKLTASLKKELTTKLEQWSEMTKMGEQFHEVNRFIAKYSDITDVSSLLSKLDSTSTKLEIPKINPNAFAEYVNSTVSYLNELRAKGKLLTEQPVYYVDSKGKTIKGIIDLIVIDSMGVAEIHDYKFSVKDFNAWNNQKQKKIEYQMMMYKNILRNYGIPVRSTNIVPITVDKEDLSVTSPISNLEMSIPVVLEQVSEGMRPGGRVTSIVGENIIPVSPSTAIMRTKKRGTSGVKKVMSELYDVDLSALDNSLSFEEYKFNVYRTYEKDGQKYHYVSDKTKIFQNSKNGKLSLSPTLLDNPTELENVLQDLYQTYLESAGTVADEMHNFVNNIKKTRNKRQESPSYRVNTSPDSTKYMTEGLKEYADEGWMILPNSEELKELGILAMTKTMDGVEIIDFIVKSEEKFSNKVEGSTVFRSNRRLLTAPAFKDSIVTQKMLLSNIPIATNGNLAALPAALWILENSEIFTNRFRFGKIKVVSESETWAIAPFLGIQETFKSMIESEDPIIRESIPSSLRNGVNKDYGSNTLVEYMNVISNLLDQEQSDASKKKLLDFKNVLLEYLKSGEIRTDTRDAFISSLYEQQKYLIQLQRRGDPLHNKDQRRVVSALITEMEGLRSDPINDLLKNGTFVGENANFSQPYEFTNIYLQAAYDIIKISLFDAQQQFTTYVDQARKDYEEFFTKQGYSGVKRILIGDMDNVFKEMIDITDSEGNHVLRIKPDDQLNPAQIELANIILEQLLEVKLGRNATKEDMQAHRESLEYRDLPLIPSSFVKRINSMLPLQAAKATFSEFIQYEKLMSLNPSIHGKPDERLTISNGLLRSLNYDREHLLSTNPIGNFTTNIQAIMYAFMSQHYRAEQFSQRIPQIDAIRQTILFNKVNSNVSIENIIETFDGLVDTAIFNKTEINTESKKTENLERVSLILSKVASLGSIGLSLGTGLSQLFQGILSNVGESVVNSIVSSDGPNISQLAKANVMVLGEELSDPNGIGLMDKLNETYQIGNFDSQFVASKMAERKGVMNFGSKWMYWLNNMPDHYNRMAYFVARMVKDGSYKAYQKQGDEYVYNPKLDNRFSIYFSGKKSNPEYDKQKALYIYLLDRMSKVVNGTRMEGDTMILNIPYTPEQSNTFKVEADRLHGFYNHEDKMKFAKTVYGRLFIQFKTWLRAKLNRYYMDTKTFNKSVGEFSYMTDENGDTKAIWKGQTMEGIIQTLVFSFYEVTDAEHEGSYLSRFTKLKDTLTSEQKRNLVRLGIDASIIGSLMVFGDLLKEWIKENRGTVKSEAARALQFALQDFNVFSTTYQNATEISLPALSFTARLLESSLDVATLEKEPVELLKNFGATRQIYYSITE